jgi:hypothetical protein
MVGLQRGDETLGGVGLNRHFGAFSFGEAGAAFNMQVSK